MAPELSVTLEHFVNFEESKLTVMLSTLSHHHYSCKVINVYFLLSSFTDVNI